jgi:hypothetical protein
MGEETMNDAAPTVEEIESSNLQLLSRLLVGLAYAGSDELFTRLRKTGTSVVAEVELAADTVPDDETMADVLSYLALGALMRGQRRVARGVRRGLQITGRATGWTLGAVDRVTDNFLFRPVRRPVERRMWGLLMTGQQAIAEGRREAQVSRKMAERTVQEIVDDLLDVILQDPQLMASVQTLLRTQSVTMTGAMVESTRELSVSADDVAEGLVRRLLRRGPRPEMLPLAEGAGAPPAAEAGGPGAPAPATESENA